MKRLLTALAAALCLATGAWASGEWNLGNVTYNLQHLGADEGGDVLTGTLNSAQQLSINDGGTITLRNATINLSNDNLKCAGLTCEGSATIILEGENTINGISSGYPGIYVPPGKTLYIKGSGTLNATGNGDGAGIGGGKTVSNGYAVGIHSGNIYIYENPTINATGNGYGAGIGGSYLSTNGYINVTGGTITARGGVDGAAGIGGGKYGTCGNIDLRGGTIVAYGGYNTGTSSYAPGIGAGCGITTAPASCGNITITYGIKSVRAYRHKNGYAFIGRSKGDSSSSCGTITIATGLLDTLYNAGGDLYYEELVPWNGSLSGLPSTTTSVTAIDGMTIYGTLPSSRYCKINIDSGAHVTVSNATINASSLSDNDSYKCAGITCQGGATITLKGTNTINGFHTGYPGIYVPKNYTLYINGNGTLNASGNGSGAGIGGGETVSNGSAVGINSGNIYIYGTPTINATGYGYAAGIGGSYSSTNGYIYISGGTVTANGGMDGGAGIGAGCYGVCGNINLSGGTIVAQGGYNTGTGVSAPGIGSGDGNATYPSSCGDITITTGITSVKATRYRYGTSWCIGKGKYSGNTYGTRTYGEGLLNYTEWGDTLVTQTLSRWDGNLATLKSDDSLVTAFNGTTIRGKFSSNNKKIAIAANATVMLSDVTINGSNSDSTYRWAGLTCLSNATINITGSNTVRGFNNCYPGIYVPTNCTLTLNGTGSLTALRNDWAAGIGGGMNLDCGNITISGNPTITASGGNYSSGIGGGRNAECGNITINGGTVTATGESNAAGIGGGYGVESSAKCGSISIGSGITRVEANLTNFDAGINPIGPGSNCTGGSVTTASSLSDVTIASTRILVPSSSAQTVDLETVDGDVVIGGTATITGELSGIHKVSLANGASVTFDNATIQGWSDDGDEFKHAAITCLGDATITLTGENTLRGFWEDYPGIYVPPGKTLTIEGSGSLVAKTAVRMTSGQGWGAGIGGGYQLPCGNIYINGGNITAIGGSSAAGIGSGYSSDCGYIWIDSGATRVVSTSNDNNPIGAGNGGSCTDGIHVYNGFEDETIGYERQIASRQTETIDGIEWSYYVLFDEVRILNKDDAGNFAAAVSPKPTGKVIIPSMLGGYPVTSIGDNAFYGCNSLTSVEIPDTVTFIGNNAFYFCFALSEANIPSGVTSIGDAAFANTSLSSVELPSGVTSIGTGAFAGTNLSSVELPSGLTSIAPETFNLCRQLENVTIPNSVTNIGDNAFSNCSRLERVVIPNGVTRIGESAFADSFEFKEVVIPNTVTTVEIAAFARTSLQNVYVSSSSEATRIKALLDEGVNTYARVPDKDNINYIVGGFEVIDGVAWYYLINETNGLYNGPATATIARQDAQGNYIPAVSPSLTGEVTIPATLGGYPVVRIGEKALNGLADITSVTIPADVTSIDFAAFAWCTGLESVTFEGEVLDHIGVAAFEGCSSLASVDIPDSTCAILERAFGSCTGLQEIKLPYGNEGLAEIGQNAFQACAPTKIYLPYSNNRSIYQGRLENPGAMNLANATIVVTGCTYDWGGYTWTYNVENSEIEICNKGNVAISPLPTGVLEFPNMSNSYIGYPVVRIGENAFNGCSGLEGVVIPSTVTSIADGAFKNCEDLCVLYVSVGDTSRVRALLNSDNIDNPGILIIEQGVGYSTDGNYTLYFRTSDGATASIYGFAGQGDSLTIPDAIDGLAVTSIGEGAFDDAAFTSITLPSGISAIGWQAFNDTLKNVYVPAGVSVSDVIEWFSGAASASGKTFYGSEPDGDGVTWYFRVPATTGSSRYAEVFKGEDIAAFSAPDGTTELTVPEKLGGFDVTKIGRFAFYRSTNLTTVDIPASVTSIGNYAFSGCTNLECIDLPQGLTAIGESLFSRCAKLTEISIPEGVVSIGYYAFNQCSGLETLVIPENVTSIGERAFWDCTKLTDIMMPASISNIVSSANKNMFDGCNALQTIYVPYGCEDDVWSSLNSSGINTFAVRDGGFEKVGDYTWYYAFNDGGQTVRIERKDKLHNLISAVSPAPVGAVQIPYTLGGYAVTGIGEKAFWNCSNLDGVVLTDYITSIGAGAFSGCADPLLIQVGMNRKSEVEQMLSQSGHDMTKINVDCGFVVDENDYYWHYNLVSDGNGGWTAEITDLIIGQNECQELIVPETLGGYPVASLADYAFSDRLTSTTIVTFPASVQTIGYGAFNGCDSLTTINVPAGSGAAMTAMLEESGLDMANITVVDPEPAKTVAEVAAELFDDAVINLTGETPSITIKTIPGFTYTVREGQTIKTMTSKSGDGKVKVGDGTEWTPTLEKYTTSGFYLIDVSK